MTASKIEWTDRSDWNPIRGCTRVSPGCGGPGDYGGCYAEAMAARFSLPGMWGHGFAEMAGGKPRWTGKVELQADRLMLPLKWKKPAKVFASSTSDFFHEKLTDEDIDQLFAVMALCPHLMFQVLTKRPERMRAYVSRLHDEPVERTLKRFVAAWPHGARTPEGGITIPLPNVWLGVSAERQQEANERISLLLQTPAAIRFVSCEPLLGPIDLTRVMHQAPNSDWIYWDNALHGLKFDQDDEPVARIARLDWVIAGGESGPRARPMYPGWVRSLRNQCEAARVPFFFKQWGEWRPLPFSNAVEQGRRSCFIDNSGSVPPGDPSTDDGAEQILEAVTSGRYTCVAHLGKAHTGAILDGHEHKAFPQVRA